MNASAPESDAAVDLDRLRRTLGAPEFAWLVARVRKRAAEGRELTGPITLAEAAAEQRRALDVLLGRAPSRGRSLTAQLGELDALVRDSGLHPGGLRAAIEALTGPVPDLRAQAAAAQAAWEAAFAPLDELARTSTIAGVWWPQRSAGSLLRRLSGSDPRQARRLAATAADVLGALPAGQGVTLPVFAARTAGDAHALDPGRALGTLVYAALESWALSYGRIDATGIPKAELRRLVWAQAGVGLDELSTRVLALGLPGNPLESLGRVLAACREAGEPCVMTLRQLNRGGDSPIVASGRDVYVCENPAVIDAAANLLGNQCPPLVCTEGHPSVAARVLLTRLCEQGARLRYHGDFDWGGFRIATTVFDLVEAQPWRFDADTYLQAIDRGIGAPLTTGEPCDTPWDPKLRTALITHRVRIEEEHLLPELLADLRAGVESNA
jgi:uncharacterized protein (TIGR02679 family)